MHSSLTDSMIYSMIGSFVCNRFCLKQFYSTNMQQTTVLRHLGPLHAFGDTDTSLTLQKCPFYSVHAHLEIPKV